MAILLLKWLRDRTRPEVSNETATPVKRNVILPAHREGEPPMSRLQRIVAPAIVLVFAVLGCGQKPAAPPPEKVAALPFIENDFPRALALAKEGNRPLFVEVWAPW
jgi:hypothetical protein